MKEVIIIAAAMAVIGGFGAPDVQAAPGHRCQYVAGKCSTAKPGPVTGPSRGHRGGVK